MRCRAAWSAQLRIRRWAWPVSSAEISLGGAGSVAPVTANALAAGRIEQVKLGGVDGYLDNLAGAGVPAVGPDDDAARRVVGQVAVDVGVAAQVLDQCDLDGQLALPD